jgi:hypothetical protein
MIISQYGVNHYGDKTSELAAFPVTANAPLPIYNTNILAEFVGTSFKFGMRDIYISDVLYQGKITSAPTIQMVLADVYYGFVSPQNVELIFSNTADPGASAGFFTQLIMSGQLQLDNLDIIISHYEPGDTPAKTFVAYGTVVDYYYDASTLHVTLSLFDIDSLQRAVLPAKCYALQDFSTNPIALSMTAPLGDIGRPYNIYFGNCSGVPLIYVKADYINDFYYYALGYGPLESVKAVYRNGVLVNPSEYTSYLGDGYAFITFTSEQKDFGGNLYTLTADVSGIISTISTPNAERNAARVIQMLLSTGISTTTIGLNKAIDSPAFAAAASICSDLGLFVDGYISSQRSVNDILNDLLMLCRGRLNKNSSGAWALTIDTAPTVIAGTFGFSDGYYDNIAVLGKHKKTPSRDALQSITLQYGCNNGKYMGTIFAPVCISKGAAKSFQNPFIGTDDVATQVVGYVVNKAYFGDKQLEITINQEGRFLNLGDTVRVIIPSLDIDALYQVKQIDRALNSFALILTAFDPAIYI